MHQFFAAVFEVAKHSGARMTILRGLIGGQVFAVVCSTNQVCELRVAGYLAKEISKFAGYLCSSLRPNHLSILLEFEDK